MKRRRKGVKKRGPEPAAVLGQEVVLDMQQSYMEALEGQIGRLRQGTHPASKPKNNHRRSYDANSSTTAFLLIGSANDMTADQLKDFQSRVVDSFTGRVSTSLSASFVEKSILNANSRG